MKKNVSLVIDLDIARMESMKRKDVNELSKFLSDTLIYTHSTGRVDSKTSLIQDIETESTIYRILEPSEVVGQDLGDTVLLVGLAQMGVIRNGKSNEFMARFTDIYHYQSGVWRMIAWQSTRIPQLL